MLGSVSVHACTRIPHLCHIPSSSPNVQTSFRARGRRRGRVCSHLSGLTTPSGERKRKSYSIPFSLKAKLQGQVPSAQRQNGLIKPRSPDSSPSPSHGPSSSLPDPTHPRNAWCPRGSLPPAPCSPHPIVNLKPHVPGSHLLTFPTAVPPAARCSRSRGQGPSPARRSVPYFQLDRVNSFSVNTTLKLLLAQNTQ